MYEEVISFWFKEISPKQWWEVDQEFDQLIKARFLQIHEKASSGELHEWRKNPEGRLAEILVLDQFSRNIFRNTPKAFSQDSIALVLAQEAISLQAHLKLSKIENNFLFMPFMHSESKLIHVIAESLYLSNESSYSYEFELKHKKIIDRFGRFPHRNKILNRQSTLEEIEFLKEPESSF